MLKIILFYVVMCLSDRQNNRNQMFHENNKYQRIINQCICREVEGDI